MMKVYDYARRDENGKFGRFLTEEEVATLMKRMNENDNNPMVYTKFVVDKVDLENGIVYGSTWYKDNY